jgi:hypothetical protein
MFKRRTCFKERKALKTLRLSHIYRHFVDPVRSRDVREIDLHAGVVDPFFDDVSQNVRREIFREPHLGTFREDSGNVQGTWRERSGNVQGTFRERSGNMKGR